MKLSRIPTLALAALILAIPIALAQDGGAQQGGDTHPRVANPTTQQVPPVEPGKEPKIVLSTNEWNFGTKWYGEPAEGTVTIKNEGVGPLTIVRVKTSCGCTAAKPQSGENWNGKVLQPGQSEELKLTYNTKKNARDVSQTVTIESNDPATPAATIAVKGIIQRAFDIKPEERVSFRLDDRNANQTQEVTLVSNIEEKVDLKLEPLPETASFTAVLEPIEPGKTFRLKVSTKPPLKPGYNNAQLTLRTGVEKYDHITVPVVAYITPRVRVYPTTIPLSAKLTQPIERKIRVAYTGQKPLKITEIQSSSELVKASLLPPAATASDVKVANLYHEVSVKLPPAAELPKEGVTITIMTDDPAPEYQKLEVKVVVRDTPARPAPGQQRTVGGATKPAGEPKPGAPTPDGEPKPGEPAPGDEPKPGEPAPGGEPQPSNP